MQKNTLSRRVSLSRFFGTKFLKINTVEERIEIASRIAKIYHEVSTTDKYPMVTMRTVIKVANDVRSCITSTFSYKHMEEYKETITFLYYCKQSKMWERQSLSLPALHFSSCLYGTLQNASPVQSLSLPPLHFRSCLYGTLQNASAVQSLSLPHLHFSSCLYGTLQNASAVPRVPVYSAHCR